MAACKANVNDKVQEISHTVGIFISSCESKGLASDEVKYDKTNSFHIKLKMVENDNARAFLIECVNTEEREEDLPPELKAIKDAGIPLPLPDRVKVDQGDNLRFLFCRSLAPAMQYYNDILETQRELSDYKEEDEKKDGAS